MSYEKAVKVLKQTDGIVERPARSHTPTQRRCRPVRIFQRSRDGSRARCDDQTRPKRRHSKGIAGRGHQYRAWPQVHRLQVTFSPKEASSDRSPTFQHVPIDIPPLTSGGPFFIHGRLPAWVDEFEHRLRFQQVAGDQTVTCEQIQHNPTRAFHSGLALSAHPVRARSIRPAFRASGLRQFAGHPDRDKRIRIVIMQTFS